MRASPVGVGDLVGGKYRVEEILAAGGMGVVVAAVHEALGQRVAIKFLRATEEDEQAGPRFVREAQVAARIQSEHVARVFDCGTTESGVAYMVMELLEGTDLAAELRGRGRLPVEEAVDILLQAIDGIASAHALGIVHRDIKPANLFLTKRAGALRCVKVLDFGISKVDAVDDALTGTSTMLGSPRYMSPEQAKSSRTVDARTDIWSLGVVLYEALDGESPFAGVTMGETLSRILSFDPPPLRDRHADVPEGLSRVIARCFERDREQRFSNVAELSQALSPFGSGRMAASVERVATLLATGQLATSSVGARASSGGAPAGRSGATDTAPTVREQIAATPAAGSEPTAGSWARPRPVAASGRGRASVVLAACASAGVALVIGYTVRGAHSSAAPAVAVAPNAPTASSEAPAVPAPPPATPPSPPSATASAPLTSVTMGETPKPPAQPAPSSSAAAAPKAPPVRSRPPPAPATRRPGQNILESSD
jgi:serine/threonine-protein kinase